MVKSFIFNKVAFDVMNHPEGGLLVKADTFFMNPSSHLYVTFRSENMEAFQYCSGRVPSALYGFGLQKQARSAFYKEFLSFLSNN